MLLNGETTVEDLTLTGFYSGGNFFTTQKTAGGIIVNVGTTTDAHTYVSGGTVTAGGTTYNVTGANYVESTGDLLFSIAVLMI